jgi:hypothetical protein
MAKTTSMGAPAQGWTLQYNGNPTGSLDTGKVNPQTGGAVKQLFNPGLQDVYSKYDKRALDFQSAENELKGALLKQGSESQRAVDEQLTALLNQNNYMSGLANQATSAQMANRGMLRSGMATNALAGNQYANLETQGNLKRAAVEQKTAIGQNVVDTFQTVADKRRQIEQQLMDLDAKSMQQAEYNSKAQNIEMQYKQMISDYATSAQNKMNLGSMFTSFAATLGMGYALSNKGGTDSNPDGSF